VHQAVGVLIVRNGLSAIEALEMLERDATDAYMDVVEYARTIVASISSSKSNGHHTT
jgi:AmiR/NasT family two-component response regulator